MCSEAVYAQTIKGKLVDEADNQPIEYASVAVYHFADSSPATGAVTNPEGLFEIEVKSGTYYLTA